MKVFNVSIHLFNLIISSSKIDQDAASMGIFLQSIQEEEIIPKLLLKSEESNTRLTNKIHEALLDLSYHPKIGEGLVSQSILERIEQHYGMKQPSHKGLLAQLALLFKMINSFGIDTLTAKDDSGASKDAAGDNNYSQGLTVANVLKAAVPAIGHSNQDVKNAAIKIVLDVQKLTG